MSDSKPRLMNFVVGCSLRNREAKLPHTQVRPDMHSARAVIPGTCTMHASFCSVDCPTEISAIKVDMPEPRERFAASSRPTSDKIKFQKWNINTHIRRLGAFQSGANRPRPQFVRKPPEHRSLNRESALTIVSSVTKQERSSRGAEGTSSERIGNRRPRSITLPLVGTYG